MLDQRTAFRTTPLPPLSAASRTFDPKGDVVAVIDEERDANDVIEALTSAGIPRSAIELLHSSDVGRIDNTFRRRRAALAQLATMIATLLGDDGRYEDEYLEEARKGHRTLVVHAPSGALVQAIRSTLADHHAHHARYYRSVVVEELV